MTIKDMVAECKARGLSAPSSRYRAPIVNALEASIMNDIKIEKRNEKQRRFMAKELLRAAEEKYERDLRREMENVAKLLGVLEISERIRGENEVTTEEIFDILFEKTIRHRNFSITNKINGESIGNKNFKGERMIL